MSLPLCDHVERIVGAVLASERVLLCTDFDGTLVPIGDDPDRCVLDDHTQRVLAALHRPPRLHVAVVSGRRLADVRQRVGLPDLVYAGNHGLEIEGVGLVFREPTAFGLRGTIAALAADVAAAIDGIDGVWLERKDLTFAIHYRGVQPETVAALHAATERTTAQAIAAGLVRLHGGKSVIEVRPRVAWDKGSAFTWLGDRLHCDRGGRLFLGDDETDEDAFRAGRDSITVRVGPPGVRSAARYVATASDVVSLLSALQRGLAPGPGPPTGPAR